MIVDLHVHHVPERFVRFVEKSAIYHMRVEPSGGEVVVLTAGSLHYGLNKTFFDTERLITRLDEMGVERAVLSLATPFVNYDVPLDLACEAAALYNDEIASMHKSRPDRFEGWAFLPMHAPDAAAKELRRAVEKLGLVGGYVPSNVKGCYLDSPEFDPIFAEATALDVPLFIHPSNPPGRERMGKYELAVVAGYLFDTTLSVYHMIFGGLLDRYPKLRLCCTHLGGYAPMLRARMQREIDTNRALADSMKRHLDDYLRSLYFDTICFEPAYARSVVEGGAVGRAHLVLGSDTPFPLGEPDPVGFIGRCFGTSAPDLATTILHSNAMDFLRLKT